MKILSELILLIEEFIFQYTSLSLSLFFCFINEFAFNKMKIQTGKTLHEQK